MGGFIPTCHAQTVVEVAKQENGMNFRVVCLRKCQGAANLDRQVWFVGGCS